MRWGAFHPPARCKVRGKPDPVVVVVIIVAVVIIAVVMIAVVVKVPIEPERVLGFVTLDRYAHTFLRR